MTMKSFVAHFLSINNEDPKDEYDFVVNSLFYITFSFNFISVILISFEREYPVLY